MQPNKNVPPIKGVPRAIIDSILGNARAIAKQTQEYCRNFSILRSPLHKDTLILRWTTIDITDVDRPLQCYQYKCFHMDGRPQDCSIHYQNQSQANTFFLGLELLYTQECATDHIQ